MNADTARRRVAEYAAVSARDDRFTHDLILDLLAYCTGTTVPFAHIYAVVNAKRPQEPAAVRAVLYAFPYFVPNGPPEGPDTGWSLDPDLHRRVSQALADGGMAAVARLRADGRPPPPAPGPPPSRPAEASAEIPPPRPADTARTVNKAAPLPARPGDKTEKAAATPPSVRPDGPRLLALSPDDLMSLLDRLRKHKALRPKDRPGLDAALACGWCTAEGKLTKAGQVLADADRPGRAAQLQAALRTVPAYQTAEQNLMQHGTLTLQQIQVLMGALPKPLRQEARAILVWLRWVLPELRLGVSTATGVAWNPAGRRRR